MGVKLKVEYSPVLHMPVLKEEKERVSHFPDSLQSHQSYAHAGKKETDMHVNGSRHSINRLMLKESGHVLYGGWGFKWSFHECLH